MDPNANKEFLAFLSSEIPPTLRPIALFLTEAQKSLRGFVSDPSGEFAVPYKRVAFCAISNGFKLLNLIDVNINDDAELCLNQFREVRQLLAQQLQYDASVLPHPKEASLKVVVNHAEKILIAEANAIMELANVQFESGLRTEAYRNFHAASVFYRVLESILPSMNYEIHEKLKVSSKMVRESATLKENLVLEHFSGSSCSEYYEIHGRNKLGKGSYGSVYLATHIVTRDERAVKVMNVDRVTSYYLRKLHTEICILKEVDHPNIIKLQDVFFGRRSVYLVTDLCRGGELYELLTSGKNQGFVFREDRASKLMYDMISSVKYLHSLGIVHRDLKLENFLFQGNSSNSPLILIDFGLSKHFDSIERMRQRVGSCYYTAPEVLSGDYDERCDIWSLGVICYMLLSGTPPFFGKTPEEIHNSTLTKEAEFPSKRFRHVSPVALDFMRCLLTKDPNRRISLAEALAHPFISGVPSPDTSQLVDPTPRARMQIIGTASGPQVILPESLKEKAVDIMSSLRLFSSYPMLSKITLQVIAHNIAVDEVQSFRSEFLSLDSDCSGKIDKQELQALAAAANSIMTSSQQYPHIAPFDNADAIFDGIVVPRRARQHFGQALGPGTSDFISGRSDNNGEMHQEGMMTQCQRQNPQELCSAGPIGSASSSHSLPDSIATTESCNSMYTNPSPSPCPASKCSSRVALPCSSPGAITYCEYLAAAICGRHSIDEDRAKVAFDLLDSGRRGFLSAEAIASFLGRDIDINRLHRDIILTKSHVQQNMNVVSCQSNSCDVVENDGVIDQETFFLAWRGGVRTDQNEAEDLHVSSMMSTDSAVLYQNI